MGALVRSSHADRFLTLLPFDIIDERMLDGFNDWGESGHDPRKKCTKKQWKVVLRTVRALKKRLPLPSRFNLPYIMYRFSHMSYLGMTYYRNELEQKEQRDIVAQGVESVYDYVLDRTSEFIDEVQGADEHIGPLNKLKLRRDDAQRLTHHLLMGDGMHKEAYLVLKELVLDPLELDEVTKRVISGAGSRNCYIPPDRQEGPVEEDGA